MAQSYFDRHKGLRVVLQSTGFVLASVAVFVGIGLYLFPTGSIHYGLADWLFPIPFLVVGIAIDFWIARGWQKSAGRSFGATFILTSVAIICGAILTSIAVMRGHWLEIVRELLRSI